VSLSSAFAQSTARPRNVAVDWANAEERDTHSSATLMRFITLF
jgi:hypothetical protein